MLRAAIVYFACVFAAGFVLGTVRVALLAPRLGERTAELIELPVMAAVSLLVARWRVARTAKLRPARQLAVGWLALAMLLGAECALGALLAGRPPAAVLFDRDPVAGAAYGAALLAFAFGPWFWARRVVDA